MDSLALDVHSQTVCKCSPDEHRRRAVPVMWRINLKLLSAALPQQIESTNPLRPLLLLMLWDSVFSAWFI